MTRKRYSSEMKFRVVVQALTGEKSPEQIAKQYGIHPNSVGLWRRVLFEHGPELFSDDPRAKELERRVAELEQLLGKKEVEIALLKNFLSQNR
jgi:transposase-like protein